MTQIKYQELRKEIKGKKNTDVDSTYELDKIPGAELSTEEISCIKDHLTSLDSVELHNEINFLFKNLKVSKKTEFSNENPE